MKPFQKIDKILKKLNRNKLNYFDEYKDELLMRFDELNVMNFNKSNKRRLKNRFKRYKAKNDVVMLYIAWLVSFDIDYENAIDISTIIATDELYSKLNDDYANSREDMYKSGYDKAIEDIIGKAKKRKISQNNAKEIGQTIINNSNKIAKELKIANKQNKAPTIDKTIERLEKEWLNINNNKVSGYIERQAEELYNKGYVDACVDNDVKYVIFRAVEDEKTTDMCRSLDGQIFKLNGLNEFTRFSASHGANIKYKINGLQQGVNLPPIDDNFHWCRSHIEYYRK